MSDHEQDFASVQIDEVRPLKPNYFVHFLSVVFGGAPILATWATMLQTAVLLQTAPEGWNLSSYYSIILQLASIGPILFPLCQKFSKRQINVRYIIYGAFLLNLSACVIAIIWIRKTVYIFGSERSLPFFVVSFMVGTTSLSSPVIFLPYMGQFLEPYMYSFMLGEAISGIIPSFLGMLQGSGSKVECILKNTTEFGNEYEQVVTQPRFTSEYFYIVIFVMVLFCLVCFWLLDNLKICKNQLSPVEGTAKVEGKNDYQYRKVNTGEKNAGKGDQEAVISQKTYKYLSFLTFLIAFVIVGILPSLHPYASLPYGAETFHLNIVIGLCLNPICPILSFFLKNRSLKAVGFLNFGWISLISYVLVCAFMSPHPVLVGTLLGKILILAAPMIGTLQASYVKICIATLLRARGGKSLMYNGSISQLGRLIGTTIGFTLVNYSGIFIRVHKKC